jgi:hypothetical protein
VRVGTMCHPVRGRRRKTSVVEMCFSMEVVSDRAAVKSSRTSSRNDLGVAPVCGPLRRDSQAGIQAQRDRHDTDSIDGDRAWTNKPSRSSEKQAPKASIHQSHFGGVKPLGARSFVRREATPSGRAASGGTERFRSSEV